MSELPCASDKARHTNLVAATAVTTLEQATDVLQKVYYMANLRTPSGPCGFHSKEARVARKFMAKEHKKALKSGDIWWWEHANLMAATAATGQAKQWQNDALNRALANHDRTYAFVKLVVSFASIEINRCESAIIDKDVLRALYLAEMAICCAFAANIASWGLWGLPDDFAPGPLHHAFYNDRMFSVQHQRENALNAFYATKYEHVPLEPHLCLEDVHIMGVSVNMRKAYGTYQAKWLVSQGLGRAMGFFIAVIEWAQLRLHDDSKTILSLGDAMMPSEILTAVGSTDTKEATARWVREAEEEKRKAEAAGEAEREAKREAQWAAAWAARAKAEEARVARVRERWRWAATRGLQAHRNAEQSAALRAERERRESERLTRQNEEESAAQRRVREACARDRARRAAEMEAASPPLRIATAVGRRAEPLPTESEAAAAHGRKIERVRVAAEEMRQAREAVAAQWAIDAEVKAKQRHFRNVANAINNEGKDGKDGKARGARSGSGRV